jgi:transcriptional regulator with XRE-family HTH domain
MSTPGFERAVRRATQEALRSFGTDIRRLREDAGITRTQLAHAAGIDSSYLGRIEDGEAKPSLEVCLRLSLALGADLPLRAYPNTGSPIRDRHQAPIEEALLRISHPRFQRFAEIAVRRPARGWIDLGLHDSSQPVFVATEVESMLRRLEQQLRWAADKAASLPSWQHWGRLDPVPAVSTLLIIRDSRANREVADEFRRLLRAAYPADPRDAYDALTTPALWPGSAMLWAIRDGQAAERASYRIVARP